MNGLICLTTLLVMLCLLVSPTTTTAAGTPNAANSTLPVYINLVGCNGGRVPDPVGGFIVTVRDGDNDPVSGSTVEICFNRDVRISDAIDGLLVECPCVKATTDLDGKAAFTITGAGFNTNGIAGYTGASAATITADGYFLGAAHVATYNENGAAMLTGVDVTDLAAWGVDFNRRLVPGVAMKHRSDFSNNGMLDVVDLSYWGRVYTSLQSQYACAPWCP